MINRGLNRVLAEGQVGPGGVAVYGEFGVGNFGNDASLDGRLRILEGCGYPPREVTCFCCGPAVVNKTHGMPAVRIAGRNPSRRLGRFRGGIRWLEKLRDLLRMMVLVRPFRYVVIPGTGIVEEGVSTWSMPFDLFVLALVCRVQRTRLVIECVGVGVPRSRLARFFFRFFLGNASYRSYRDE